MTDLTAQTKHPLVLATLTQNDADALVAWASWYQQIDFDKISYEELVLLPRVYQRLKTHPGFDSSERLPGIARKFFYQNTLLRQELDEFTRELQATGHVSHAIGDVMFTDLTNQESRVIQSLEVFISRDGALSAISILQRHGWNVKTLKRTGVILEKNSFSFQLTCQLSKHWNSMAHNRLTQISDQIHFALCLLLLRKFRDGKWSDLQSAIDFALLLWQTPIDRNLHKIAGDFGLVARFAHAAGNQQAELVDPLDHLEHLYQAMLAKRSLASKWRYHRERFRLAATGSSFYRYWQEHRQEIRATNKWIRQIQSLATRP